VDFEPALAQELKTISALNGRVYPLTGPEQRFDLTQPYLIYGSSEGMRTKELGSGYQAGKAVPGEINVIAPRYADAKAIMKDVIALLVGMERRVIGTDGPFIQELTYEAPVELYEEAPKLYRCLLQFEVYF
jgi:hypothetical protein